MRRAHDIPPLVKGANLARWFPPCIVTREQWPTVVQHVTASCFGNSCRYSVAQLHWGAAVPPLSGRQSFGNSWGFL